MVKKFKFFNLMPLILAVVAAIAIIIACGKGQIEDIDKDSDMSNDVQDAVEKLEKIIDSISKIPISSSAKKESSSSAEKSSTSGASTSSSSGTTSSTSGTSGSSSSSNQAQSSSGESLYSVTCTVVVDTWTVNQPILKENRPEIKCTEKADPSNVIVLDPIYDVNWLHAPTWNSPQEGDYSNIQVEIYDDAEVCQELTATCSGTFRICPKSGCLSSSSAAASSSSATPSSNSTTPSSSSATPSSSGTTPSSSGATQSSSSATPSSSSSRPSSSSVASSSSMASSSSLASSSSSSSSYSSKGYYIFKFDGINSQNKKTAYDTYAYGYKYNGATLSNESQVFEQGVLKLKNAVIGNSDGGAMLGMKDTVQANSKHIADCKNGFSYWYKSNASHKLFFEFDNSVCTAGDNKWDNKWVFDINSSSSTWTKQVVNLSAIKFPSPTYGDCDKMSDKTFKLDKVVQMSWGFDKSIPSFNPNTSYNLIIANIVCLDPNGTETINDTAPDSSINW
jgi:hypothetical protein